MIEKAKPKIEYMPGGREIIITTEYEAPRDMVYRAYTDPELIRQWWGPREFTTTIEKNELKEGGVWRFVQKDREGKEYPFRGVYHTLSPSEFIVQTFEWEGMPGHVSLQTARFDEKDGKTTVKAVAVFETVEDRDGMISSGMQKGVDEGAERLGELLERLKSGEEMTEKKPVGIEAR